MAEGRRIGLSKACENPTCAEIGDCCNYLKLPFAIERVKVLLKKEDGNLFNPNISSRKQLMLRVADMVPKHHGRTKKQEAAVSTSNAGASNKSGKGGKKRR
ncbi:Signal recognition particle 19 kDa protein [Arachis hypogaea]|nr:Signal recognition particle 19 kDa protein [Arachis hypogaea]